MKTTTICWVIAAAVATLNNGFSEPRTWTDAQGRTVKAEFVEIKAGKVTLKFPNGKTMPFPFNRLSEADQAYVKRLFNLNPANIARQIDAHVNRKLAKEGIEPNPPTTEEQFVRRAYLEITGTIPTFDQALDFLESEDSDKRRKLIDQLLDTEGYISHSFNWYADMLRLVSRINDFYVYETYNQWIKDSIRQNKPYDQLVYEMLTSQGRIWDNPASGYFLRDRGMPLDNLSTTVAVFLGTEITCAQCHDHPFEDWTQMDFYQIYAFLAQRQDRPYGREFGQMLSKERGRIETEQRQEDESLGEKGFVQPFRNVISATYAKVWDDESKALTLPADYKYDDGKPGQPVTPRTLFGESTDRWANDLSPVINSPNGLRERTTQGLLSRQRTAFGNAPLAKPCTNPWIISHRLMKRKTPSCCATWSKHSRIWISTRRRSSEPSTTPKLGNAAPLSLGLPWPKSIGINTTFLALS